MSRIVVMGVDLSFTGGLGLCAVPAGWALQWGRLSFDVLTPPEGKTLGEQLRYLARGGVAFARSNRVTHGWIETLPTARAFNAVTLGRVEGALRLAMLDDLGLELLPAPLSTARKLLLGKLPQGKGKAKKAALAAVDAFAGEPIEGNAADAFVAANFGLAELGEVFVGHVAA